MTTCKHIRELLPLWAGNDLTDAVSQTVADHLGGCADCAAEAEAWRLDLTRTVAAAAAEAPPPLPVGLVEATVAVLSPSATSRHRLTTLQPLAAAAVLLVLLWWHPLEHLPSPAQGVAWHEVQDAFHGCLEDPIPITQWDAPTGAGVVALFKRDRTGDRYELTDCLEGDNLAAWRRYPWLQQRLRTLADDGDDIVVAVCRDQQDDRVGRRRLRRDALAELR